MEKISEDKAFEHIIGSIARDVYGCIVTKLNSGPDFDVVKNGVSFYLEATIIEEAAFSRYSGIPNEKFNNGAWYGPVDERIEGKIEKKLTQLKKRGKEKPVLLSIGTYHMHATAPFRYIHIKNMLHFSPVPTDMSVVRSKRRYELHRYYSMFHYLDFCLSGENVLQERFPHISAIVFASVNCDGVRLIGVKNPNPYHAFDESVFPDIPFCGILNWNDIDWTHMSASYAGLSNNIKGHLINEGLTNLIKGRLVCSLADKRNKHIPAEDITDYRKYVAE